MNVEASKEKMFITGKSVHFNTGVSGGRLPFAVSSSHLTFCTAGTICKNYRNNAETFVATAAFTNALISCPDVEES